MPTENRSSNTEQMVSVPRSLLEEACNGLRITQDRARKELRVLLAQPAAQHQGEPVGEVLDSLGTIQWANKPPVAQTKLYTHPDAGEIEQLSRVIRDLNDERDEMGAECARLRADAGEVQRWRGEAARLKTIADNYCALNMDAQQDLIKLRADLKSVKSSRDAFAQNAIDLSAQLAERDALLRDINKRHSSGVDFDLPADLAARVAAVCATSAEPSALAVHPVNMKTMMQAYEQVDHKTLLHGTSNWCSAMATALRGVLHAEPSAPVEIDERAAFEKWFSGTGLAQAWGGSQSLPDDYLKSRYGIGGALYSGCCTQSRWEGWQARAALERKP